MRPEDSMEEMDLPGFEERTVTVPAEGQDERLDVFLSKATEFSRSAISSLAEEGRVLRAGNPLRKKDRVSEGDVITLRIPPPEPIEALPENIPLDIRYEDEDIIVVNKAAGMVVHPAPGNPDGTLVNALLYHCGTGLSGIGGAIRPGIVHRIDKDTSGLLVVAKNDMAHAFLSEELKRHAVSRIYTAVAIGAFRDGSGVIDAPVGRHPTDRKRMAVLRDPSFRARDAVTHYTVKETYHTAGETFSLLSCELETGRTHQIRVHMASVGHPLLGDPVYGGDRTRFGARHGSCLHGQMLHAGELSLTHPRTGERMHFVSEAPEDFRRLLSLLEIESGMHSDGLSFR